MKESYREGIANHPGPEPCEGSRKAALEALDRGICRLGIELRNPTVQGADGVRLQGRQQRVARQRECGAALRSRRPQACRETPCARTGRPRGRPRIVSGPVGERDKRQVSRARRRGVERPHSTNEICEQGQGTVGGADGGKAVGQGESHARADAGHSAREHRCTIAQKGARVSSWMGRASLQGGNRVR